jgi:exonuclease SbcD
VIRFLHTSDWHLGLELGGHDRLPEQERFLAWLLDRCVEREVDALLVAGDVYDVLQPPIAAQALLARFLVEFHRRLPDSVAVLIAGNHDSAPRMEAPLPFAEALGRIHLVGNFHPEDPVRHLIALTGADGRPAAWCLAIPFLRPSDLECRLLEDELPEAARCRAIAEAYSTMVALARKEDPTLPVVAMGHLSLAGSLKAGSERVLIGGVESVAAEAIAAGADYMALGHIHRGQQRERGNVRYCGTPYPVGFDEVRHRHQVLIVELEATGDRPRIEALDVPVFVELLRLYDPPTTWEELEKRLRETDWTAQKALQPELRPLAELVYLATPAVSDLRNRHERLARDLPLRLVGAPRAIHGERSGDEVPIHRVDLDSASGPSDVLERHWLRCHGTKPPDELAACFGEILADIGMEGRG